LLAAKAEINAKNKRGDTPVFVAVRARQLAALRALVKAGADRRLRNADGQNAAEVATAAGFTELVPLLKR
jgi:ankyrin repeat protein